MKNWKKNIHDWGLTVIGYIGAVCNVIINIDWLTFNMEKEWPKLLASVVMVIVAHKAQFIIKKKEEPKE